MLKRIDRAALRLLGMRAIWPLLAVVLGCVAGAMVGWGFPKFEVYAMLQFPDAADKQDAIDLQAYKRIAASFDSPVLLATYLQKSEGDSAAGRLLLKQAQKAGFWDGQVAPVLPFTRRDQRQFGDLKDVAANALIGLDLSASAPSEFMAAQVLQLLANYVADAVVRERIRSWILTRRTYGVAAEEKLRAEVLRAELDIELNERRAKDMKSIIARYPEAARMDERQMLSISPLEGAERFFSPLTQLIGAESAISQRRERIARLERELRQARLLAPYFVKAETAVNQSSEVGQLINVLRDLTQSALPQSELQEDWAAEAILVVRAALEGFAEMRNQMGIRADIRSRSASSRDPTRLALLGLAVVVGMFAAVALMRANGLLLTNEEREMKPMSATEDIATADSERTFSHRVAGMPPDPFPKPAQTLSERTR